MTRKGLPAIPNAECVILSLGSQSAVSQRLVQMGLLPGSRINVVRVGPLGDPLALATDTGQQIALRSGEAASIECQVLALPLAAAEPGERVYRIRELRGGRGLQRKLQVRGVAPGIEATVLSTRPFRLRLLPDGQVVSLGRGEAEKILLEPCEAAAVRA